MLRQDVEVPQVSRREQRIFLVYSMSAEDR